MAVIVVLVVEERLYVADEPVELCRRLGAVLAGELAALGDRPGPDRLARRARKFAR